MYNVFGSDDMNIVIYGEEKMLLEKKLNQLKAQYHISAENMNLATYRCQETSMREILEDALTPPFLSEYKMIVLKEPLFLTTQKQKNVSEEDVKMFLDYLSKDNPTTIFVIYHDCKNFDERKKVVKTLRKTVNFYEVSQLDHHQLLKIVDQSIRARGCHIDKEALELFLSRMPNRLLDISQEVEKMCLYTKEITVETVDKMVTKQIEENVFELSTAILNKDMKQAMHIYRDLMLNKEEPVKLIGLIASSLRLLYQVKLLDRKGYNDREIAQMLSLNPYRLKYIRKDGKDYELGELLKKIEELSKLDVQIKTGKIDKYKGLELFLIKIGG